ncbi:BLUF domain-containing protein [Leucobacter sp. USHLN153]|uniref:BLUF domain-containing protein n=1 Tax=Leucobacter sp. USHLN153 TaxID=3081268 RepID=UPI00301A893E
MQQQHHSVERDEALKSLVYASTATRQFSDAELDELLRQARERNEQLDITGMLTFRDGKFVQFLEGTPEHIDELMRSIRADERHRDVSVLIEEPLAERQFTSWTMGYERMRDIQSAPPAGFRDTYADLDSHADSATTARAARELALWFKVRSGRR